MVLMCLHGQTCQDGKDGCSFSGLLSVTHLNIKPFRGLSFLCCFSIYKYKCSPSITEVKMEGGFMLIQFNLVQVSELVFLFVISQLQYHKMLLKLESTAFLSRMCRIC